MYTFAQARLSELASGWNGDFLVKNLWFISFSLPCTITLLCRWSYLLGPTFESFYSKFPVNYKASHKFACVLHHQLLLIHSKPVEEGLLFYLYLKPGKTLSLYLKLLDTSFYKIPNTSAVFGSTGQVHYVSGNLLQSCQRSEQEQKVPFSICL